MIKRLRVSLIVGLSLILTILFVSMVPSATLAQADTVLPPRPTPEPLTTSSNHGATIMLNVLGSDVESLDADDWAVVQWQDAHGEWNNVEGWQGNLAYNASSQSWEVIWWVARANFGEKSFRWAVYSDSTKSRLEATSPIFDLPENQMHGVTVSLAD